MSGPLPNQRHEAFAHALARGETCDRAYQLAGFKPNRGNASVLKAKQHIKDRVAQIQGNIAIRVEEKVAVDKAYVLSQAHRMFEASADAATGEDFDPKAANAAARFLDQIGRHVDVQAFKDTSDVNVHITIDAAISKLEAVEVIEGDYERVDE